MWHVFIAKTRCGDDLEPGRESATASGIGERSVSITEPSHPMASLSHTDSCRTSSPNQPHGEEGEQTARYSPAQTSRLCLRRKKVCLLMTEGHGAATVKRTVDSVRWKKNIKTKKRWSKKCWRRKNNPPKLSKPRTAAGSAETCWKCWNQLPNITKKT